LGGSLAWSAAERYASVAPMTGRDDGVTLAAASRSGGLGDGHAGAVAKSWLLTLEFAFLSTLSCA
jgi:hypothetical protein